MCNGLQNSSVRILEFVVGHGDQCLTHGIHGTGRLRRWQALGTGTAHQYCHRRRDHRESLRRPRARARARARRHAGANRGRRGASSGRNSSTSAVGKAGLEFSKASGGGPPASTRGGLWPPQARKMKRCFQIASTCGIVAPNRGKGPVYLNHINNHSYSSSREN